MEVAGYGLGGIPDIADIRLLVGVQRRGNTDGDEIHVLDKGEVGGGPQHPGGHQLPQVGIHHVANVVRPGVYQVHLFLLDIKADGTKPMLGLVHRKRQAHVAQAADTH